MFTVFSQFTLNLWSCIIYMMFTVVCGKDGICFCVDFVPHRYCPSPHIFWHIPYDGISFPVNTLPFTCCIYLCWHLLDIDTALLTFFMFSYAVAYPLWWDILSRLILSSSHLFVYFCRGISLMMGYSFHINTFFFTFFCFPYVLSIWGL